MSNTLMEKYRPLQLHQVIGHKKIILEFENLIKKQNLPHNIFLVGDSGTGKTSLAKILARHILCQNKTDTGYPCLECDNCLSVEHNTISDCYYHYIGSNINMDEAREIIDIASSNSIGQDIKVFHLEEVQEISKNRAAEKALLDILEIAPDNVYFIFTSMDKKATTQAVLDRFIVYNLKSLAWEEIALGLQQIAEKEKLQINSEIANILITIAQNSQGSFRRAIGYLFRMINSQLFTEEELYKELDIISDKELSAIINKILKKDVSVFQHTFNRELINDIRYVLNICLKGLNKCELTAFEQSKVKGIQKTTKEDIFKILHALNELNKYFFIDTMLIQSTILNIFMYVSFNKLEENKPRERERV